MNSFEYIVSKLKKLVELCPQTRARYEYNRSSLTHFIEVVPNEVYRLDKDFHNIEEEITFEFIRAYPQENICFISDDAFIGIDHIDFHVEGKQFRTNGLERTSIEYLIEPDLILAYGIPEGGLCDDITYANLFNTSIQYIKMDRTSDVTTLKEIVISNNSIFHQDSAEQSGESNYLMAA